VRIRVSSSSNEFTGQYPVFGIAVTFKQVKSLQSHSALHNWDRCFAALQGILLIRRNITQIFGGFINVSNFLGTHISLPDRRAVVSCVDYIKVNLVSIPALCDSLPALSHVYAGKQFGSSESLTMNL